MKVLPIDPTIKEIDIYVIVSQISDEIFVWKTKSTNCYKAYKEHAAGRAARTKTLFERSEEKNKFPYMYCLETLHTNEELAFRHCIAWTKYFIDHGFTSCAYETVNQYASDMNECTQKIYKKIKITPIDEILNEENLVVSNYKKRQKKNASVPIISICVDPKEYEAIQRKAEKFDMSMSMYCKNMALTEGGNISIESPPFTEHTAELREAKIVLKQILYAYYRNGRYYPADLENIQKMVDKISETERQLSRAFRKYANEVMKALPK